MKHCFAIGILMALYTTAAAQLDSILVRIDSAQAGRMRHFMDEERESAFAEFDAAMQAYFDSPAHCGRVPSSVPSEPRTSDPPGEHAGIILAYHLMNGISYIRAGNLALYSWDDLGGGNYHSYTNYLRYLRPDQSCSTMPIDTAAEETEVGYFRIERIYDPVRERYLFWGYGTYGGGMQHYSLSVYEITGDTVQRCNDCFPTGGMFVQECHRWEAIDFEYDPKTSIISYGIDTKGTSRTQPRNLVSKLYCEDGVWRGR